MPSNPDPAPGTRRSPLPTPGRERAASWARISAALTLLAFGVVGCNDDGGGEDAGSFAPDAAQADAGLAFGDEAYFVFSRIRTPSDRTMFASILPQLEAGEVDLSASLELSGLSRARIFDGKLYAFDGETGVATRYVVGPDGSLTSDSLPSGEPAEMSFAGLGITRFSDLFIFVDETRAFFVDTIFEDLVVEWNPTTMTITRSFDAGLVRDGFDASTGGVARIGDTVAIPLSYTNFVSGAFVDRLAIAVLDLADATSLTVIEDDRCAVTGGVFPHDGAIYVVGDSLNGTADIGSPPDTVPPPCVVRWRPGEAAFDPDFYLDLRELTGAPHIGGVVSRGDGTFSTHVYTSDVDPRTLDLRAVFDDPLWQRAIIDVEAETVEIFDALPPSGITAPGWVLNDEYLVPSLDSEGGTSSLHRLRDDVPELFTVTGELFVVDRVR